MFKNLRNSVLFKIGVLVLLTLLLCIPLAEIGSLINERGGSRREAAEELGQTYAGPQTLVAPLLIVPYTERWSEEQRNSAGNVTGTVGKTKALTHMVFPETLRIEGTMAPQQRYRGIFNVLFYTFNAGMEGRFAAFDPASIPRSETGSTIEAGTPYLALGVSDLRGLDGSPALTLAGERLRFMQRVPGLGKKDAWLAGGIHAPLAGGALKAWSAREALPFTLKLGLVGQETLSIAPIADDTTAHITSPWAAPSFGGRFLASERSVTPQGFDAHWRVSSLVSAAREQVRSGVGGPQGNALETFDVTLAEPLNVYAMSTRAVKYGALFVGLVLMAGFMFELFRKLRLHPVQYGLVGLSIALFFLLLLALSEKLLFWQAYSVAATASVSLLAVYFSSVLGGWWRGASFAAFVALLYGALYGLLASESNALLLGALLVFGMLAVLMLATRKVDWYALSNATTGQLDTSTP